MSHIITYNEEIQKTGKKFRETKTKITDIIEKRNEKIHKETEKERKDLETAVKKYQDKVDYLMKKQEFKDDENKLEHLTKEMKTFAYEAYKFYNLELQNIEKQNTSLEQKNKAKQELIKYIMEQFMTEKEKSFFEDLLNGNQTLMVVKNSLL